MPQPVKLARSFYAREALDVARDLLGLRLVHVHQGVRRVGRIVETEAYKGPQDLAAHSARGRTARTEVMFGPPGHAYVYFIYGFWHCLNVVVAAEGIPHAILIRAVEPLAHIEEATWGPGLLCRALGIDRRLNGEDLCGDVLWIERAPRGEERDARVARSARIGVDYAGAWARRQWRFFDRDSPYVSTVSRAARRRVLKGQPGTRQSRGR